MNEVQPINRFIRGEVEEYLVENQKISREISTSLKAWKNLLLFDTRVKLFRVPETVRLGDYASNKYEINFTNYEIVDENKKEKPNYILKSKNYHDCSKDNKIVFEMKIGNFETWESSRRIDKEVPVEIESILDDQSNELSSEQILLDSLVKKEIVYQKDEAKYKEEYEESSLMHWDNELEQFIYGKTHRDNIRIISITKRYSNYEKFCILYKGVENYISIMNETEENNKQFRKIFWNGPFVCLISRPLEEKREIFDQNKSYIQYILELEELVGVKSNIHYFFPKEFFN